MSNLITSSGGIAPYTYFIVSGTMPPGLSLSSSGLVYGTSSLQGNYTFTIKSVDSSSFSGSRSYTITCNSPVITLTPLTLPGGTSGSIYTTTQMTASGGVSPYSYSVLTGSNYFIGQGFGDYNYNGIYQIAGTYDGQPYYFIQTGDLTTKRYLWYYAAGDDYTLSLTLGGTAVYVSDDDNYGINPVSTYESEDDIGYIVSSSSSFPPGILINASGSISGTPSQTGSYYIGIQAQDSYGSTGIGIYTISICSNIIVLPLSVSMAISGSPFTQVFTSSFGASPFTYSQPFGTVPTGLSFNTSTGVLSGTPTTEGFYTYVVRITDEMSCSGTQSYSQSVSPVITLSPSTLLGGVSGSTYTIQQITASGGIGPYIYTSSSGAFPSGITMNSSGSISGTPSVTGSYPVVLKALDSYNFTGSASYNIYICPAMSIQPAVLATPTSSIGNPYTQTFTTIGTAPVTFITSSGTLPTGLTLSSGVLSGTPTTEGIYTYTISATDAGGCNATRSYNQMIAPVILLSTISSSGTINTLYNQQITSSGGIGPYTYSTSSGAIPPGLYLTSSGIYSGSITGTDVGSAANYGFTVVSTDSLGFTGSNAYAISMSINNPSYAIQLSGSYYGAVDDSSSFYGSQNFSTHALTIEFWAKTTNALLDQYYALACSYDTLYSPNTYALGPNGRGWGFISYPPLTQSRIIWGGYNNSASTTPRFLSCPTISTGSSFTHLRFCQTTSSAYLFRDGILMSTSSWLSSMPEYIQDATMGTSITPSGWGMTFNLTSNMMDNPAASGFIPTALATMTIDEFRISNICRTTGSIIGQQYFTSSATNVGKNFTVDANTMIYLKFNEGSGNVSYDSTTHNNSVTSSFQSSSAYNFNWVAGV